MTLIPDLRSLSRKSGSAAESVITVSIEFMSQKKRRL